MSAFEPTLVALREGRIDPMEAVAQAERGTAKHLSEITLPEPRKALPVGIKPFEDHLYLCQEEPTLNVLAARPAVGKTALATQIAYNLSLHHKHGAVLFFSLEMTARQLKERIVGLESGRPVRKINELQPGQLEHIHREMSKHALYIDDETFHLDALVTRALDFHRHTPVSLIVVDYLQKVRVPTGRTKTEEVQAVSEGLTGLAKKLSRPILALAQTSRDIEKRSYTDKDSRPVLSDLADSASIEREADRVFFLRRRANVPGEVDVLCGKNRHGEYMDFSLQFSGTMCKFLEKDVI